MASGHLPGTGHNSAYRVLHIELRPATKMIVYNSHNYVETVAYLMLLRKYSCPSQERCWLFMKAQNLAKMLQNQKAKTSVITILHANNNFII